MYGSNPQEIEISPTVRSNHWTQIQLIPDIILLVYRRARPFSWSRTEHTTGHKCVQNIVLYTTELALHLFVLTIKCVYKSCLLLSNTLCSHWLYPAYVSLSLKTTLWQRLFLWLTNAQNSLVLVPKRCVHHHFVCNLPGCVLHDIRLGAGRLGRVEGHQWYGSLLEKPLTGLTSISQISFI